MIATTGNETAGIPASVEVDEAILRIIPPPHERSAQEFSNTDQNSPDAAQCMKRRVNNDHGLVETLFGDRPPRPLVFVHGKFARALRRSSILNLSNAFHV